MDRERIRNAWGRSDMHRTVFLFRAVAWAGASAFSLGSPYFGWVLATGGVIVVGGIVVAQRAGYRRVNLTSFAVELLLVTGAIRLTGGLASGAYLLYGGIAILLTVYGAMRWSLAGVGLLVVLYAAAVDWRVESATFWFRVVTLGLFVVAAGALGQAYVRRENVVREARRRLEQMETLRTIQEGLLKEEPLEVLLEALLGQAVSLMQMDGGYIGIVEPGGRLRMKAMTGMPEAFRTFVWDPAVSEPTRTVCRAGQTMAFDEAELVRVNAREPLEVGFKMLVAAPLYDGARLLGVMGLGSRRPRPYLAEDREIMDTLASLASGQIRYDRERAANRKRGRLLTTLERVGKLVNSNLRMQNLLPVLHQTVAEELETDSFFVLLTIPGNPYQGYMAYLYDEGRSYEPTTVTLTDNSPTMQVLRSGEPHLWEGEPQGASTIGSDRPVAGMLVAPLSREGRVIGAISAQSYRAPYDQDHLDFLSAVANQAAIAIHNAQLYQRAEEVAMTDHMTGLGNARRFNLVGEEILRQAVEGRRPLSVILIDSDSLKQVNDRYGHSAGDAHLQHLARTILDNIRTGDQAFRYAGDEFVVLLPDTEMGQATKVAERIRRAVAEGFVWQGQRLHNISISVGVTELNAADLPDITMEELFSRADQAMYQAKMGGKNRVSQGPS
jgi:diguanylate cyclase (GGDEF)-like protein